jgi:hypothetical protein
MYCIILCRTTNSFLLLEKKIGLGDCNALCYGSPNPSQITVISVLVMHDATGLFNSESSQRHF